MNKTKTKRSLLKTVAAGFAFILSSAFFPTSVIALAEDWKGETAVNNNSTRIEVGQADQTSKVSVKKGDTVTVPVGEYYKAGVNKQIGSDALEGSSITITYKTTGDVVKEVSNKSAADLAALTFVAEKIGTYVVTYKVVDADQVYTYDMTVVSTSSEASFEFTSNDENVLPSVYDTKIANAKNIVLPLPIVNDEDGEAIIDGDAAYYTTDATGAGIADHFVYVSVTNGSEAITVKSNDDGLYIDGQDLTDNAATLDGQEFKVTYSYYEKKGDTKVYIASTSKTFTVKNGYYYLDSTKADDKRGLELKATLSTTVDTAVVGVEKPLPTVTAKTKTANYPSEESVNVYYTIKVLKYAGSGYTEDVTADTLVDGNKFKAKEEGSYRFVYTVKDFYGNEDTTLSFDIDKVKDTQAAKVYMYDAGDYTVTDNVYTTAEKKLKTQTVPRNIIMYAVAGTDNMVEDVTVRREVKDASGLIRFTIGSEEYQEVYNGYNLVFAPSKADGDSVYTQIVSDNYEIYRQLILAEVDVTNASAVETWLKAHYLLVTTEYNKDVNGNNIVAEPAGSADEVSAADIAAMKTAGYAYIPANTTNKKYTFTEQTYNFWYYASDNNNSESHVNYSVKLTNDFTDSAVPTLTFATDLQNVYLPDETITFEVATASDTVDASTRLDVVTAYRYLQGDKTTPVAAGDSTLKYVIAGEVATKDATKWYVTSKDANGLVESEGWYVDSAKSSYSINLANAPADAKYVEILCYAVDDYGNVGFYNRIIQIASATDEDMPVLFKVLNAPDTAYEAPNQITLPTLQYKDGKVEYMHADVTVYKVANDGTKKVMQNAGMRTSYDTVFGIFTVDAGYFNASTAGKYQVAVSVVDAGNHSVTTYFNYTVVSGTIIEDPELENITSESKSMAVDEKLHLATPTWSLTESDDYGYVGVNKEDDSYTAENYTVSVVYATTSDYEIDQHYFTPKAKGTYKLQYTVSLLRYSKQALEDGDLTLTNGQLAYIDKTDGDKAYYVYQEFNGSEYELHFNSDPYLREEATELTGAQRASAELLVKGFTSLSNIQTVTVDSVVIKSLTVGDAYQKTQYTTTGEKLEIVKPEVVVSGKGGVNLEESKVTVTVVSGSTTRTLATITFDKWEELVASNDDFEVDGNTIKLKLDRNGKYTIKYSVQAMDEVGEDVGTAKTLEYTISNGDVVAPEINFEDNFINTKYSLGDELVLNMAGLTVSDKVTTDTDELLSTMTVVLKNKDTDQSWTLENTAEDGNYSYEHKLDVAGDYTLTITIKDEAGNKASKDISFTVSTESSSAVDAKEVLGGVLIGISVAILVGVVAYFVVSKVKLDKKEKRYSENKKK